jgi:hypothetical protein
LGNWAYLDTLALWQTDPWLLLADDKDVAFPCSELVVDSVLDVNDVEASVVAFTMSDDTYTAHVATTSDHSNDTSVELDEFGDLAGSEVNLNCIVDPNSWVWVPDPAKPSAFHITKHWSNG